MANVKQIPMVPEDEYLAAEKDRQVRHEYVAGQIYAMTGGSVYHNRIAGNLFGALKSKTSQRGCDVFIADMKVKTEHAFYYPDLMVVCDPTDTDPYTKTQPLLIVEVVSPNTRAIDEREKRQAYQALPSLREYLLAEQDRAEARLIRRTEEGWEQELLGPDDLVELRSLDLMIAIQAVYEGVWR